ncbi:MAG: cistern family PEP-CTERM protein [Novosphingobium sp.]|nr:cistern family PEP-CTERM protein [Novosphingobium sp.]
MLSFRKLAPALALAATFVASPALADAIVFDASDAGTNYTLNYDGNISGTTVGGLSGSTVFTLTGISGNTYNFNYSVTNTSTSPLTSSRISSFAFNVDPSITSATSTGAFAFTTLNSNYPNGVGLVDVCFKDAATGSCAGGGGGGLTMGQSGTGTFSLSFAQPVTSATLSDFFLRYQSISGAGFNGASGTGSGTVSSTSTSSGGTPVPEPGMLGLMAMTLMLGAAAHGRRRRQVLRAA